MASRRDVGVLRPLLGLERHVALLRLVIKSYEQHRHAVSGRMLQGERDEDEAHAQLAELIPGDRVLLVVPLEGRRVIEREPRTPESLADLRAELLCRPSL